MIGVDVLISKTPVPYSQALTFMDERVQAISLGQKPPAIWLLQHPHLFTQGTGSDDAEIIDLQGVPVHKTGRGGKITYHGPGQCILYAMLPLKDIYLQPDLHNYVLDMEKSVINTLKHFGITTHTTPKLIGVWHGESYAQKKIAAVGIRVRKWITLHGVAVNINPEIEYFSRIIPCGIANYGVTSCEALGFNVTMEKFQQELAKNFLKIIGCEIKNTYEI